MAWQTTGTLFSGFGAVAHNLPSNVGEAISGEDDLQGAGFRRETPSAAPRPPIKVGGVKAVDEFVDGFQHGPVHFARKAKHEFKEPTSRLHQVSTAIKGALNAAALGGDKDAEEYKQALEEVGLGYGRKPQAHTQPARKKKNKRSVRGRGFKTDMMLGGWPYALGGLAAKAVKERAGRGYSDPYLTDLGRAAAARGLRPAHSFVGKGSVADDWAAMQRALPLPLRYAVKNIPKTYAYLGKKGYIR